MSASVRVIKDTGGAGVRALVARLRDAALKHVLVGVPAGPAEEDGMSLAHLAAIHEFGGFVKPHSRVKRQLLRFNPRTGRLIGAASSKIIERGPGEGKSGPIREKIVNRNINAILVRAKNATFENGITIPARPFLRPGIRANLNRTSRIAKRVLSQVARGQLSPVGAMEAIGIDAAGAVKRYIVTGELAPNAPSTIRKKGSSRPLIDSGALRQAITHVVEGTWAR